MTPSPRRCSSTQARCLRHPDGRRVVARPDRIQPWPRATGEFSDDAHIRLSTAISGFGDTRARAVTLRATRLFTMHLHAGHIPEGRAAARCALAAAPGLRSALISRDLATVNTAELHPEEGW